MDAVWNARKNRGRLNVLAYAGYEKPLRSGNNDLLPGFFCHASTCAAGHNLQETIF
jgi:hypothetical protein